MARNNFTVTTAAEVALAAATAKTILCITAPANIGVAIKSIDVTFDSTNPAQDAVLVELVRYTGTAGTSSGATVSKKYSGTDTIQTTGAKNYSVEPGTPEVLRAWNINMQGGVQHPLPLDGEYIAKGGEKIGVRCTAPAAVNAQANMECEE